MRTTITIDEHLLARVKQRAAATGRTVSQTIEDALRESLQRATRRPESRVELLTWHGGKPMPGVDLDDNAALLDLLERAD
jgi:Arc/MetJ family transcription regulator